MRVLRTFRQQAGRWKRYLWHRRTTWSGRFALTLIYHRVSPDVGADYFRLCVTPQHLAEQIEWLMRRFAIVPLVDVGRPDRRPRVALTFDDGYADNLHHALPVLERYGVPATVFVTTGYVGSGREFWWDELERIVLLGEKALERVQLEGPGGAREWSFDSVNRLASCWDLHSWLKPLDPQTRDALLGQLRSAFGNVPPPRTTHRPLTVEELLQLARSPLITLGGHTVNHVSLGGRPLPEQEREIRQSLEQLREWTGRPTATFSYPYGGGADIGEHAPGIVRRAGCVLARANHPGLVVSRSDCFRLPGLLVRDWDGETFGRRLHDYLAGASYDDR
jgi:peptidoglycan/xylan/chitin deacetylase (PgdA/CDA1 family)